MTKKLDLTKPIRTRDGESVEIITTHGRGDQPIIGYVGCENTVCSWDRDGSLVKDRESSYDLINILEKRVVWLNVCTTYSYGYPTKEIADRSSGRSAMARLRIELPDDWEGRFDEEELS